MTQDELAQLRGELLGLEILTMHSLSFIAAHVSQPVRFLDRFGEVAIEGVMQNQPRKVSPRYLELFQQAAITVVLRSVRAAQSVVQETEAHRDA